MVPDWMRGTNINALPLHHPVSTACATYIRPMRILFIFIAHPMGIPSSPSLPTSLPSPPGNRRGPPRPRGRPWRGPRRGRARQKRRTRRRGAWGRAWWRARTRARARPRAADARGAELEVPAVHDFGRPQFFNDGPFGLRFYQLVFVHLNRGVQYGDNDAVQALSLQL